VIRVLLAEDSAATREHLSRLIEGDPELSLVGVASDGEEAVALTRRLRPDVILMDVHMPRVDGYEATARIMAHVPTPIVMTSASISPSDSLGAFDALGAGALMMVRKPRGGDRQDALGAELVRALKLMAEVKVVRRRGAHDGRARPARPAPAASHGKIGVVAIAASTGGPPAVAEILASLPRSLGCPVLLVQHMTPGFTTGFVEWLGRATSRAVKLAEQGEPARAGVVYVAPDGVQMGIGEDGRIRLARSTARDGFRPSGSHLLQSVAESYGAAAIGIVLTGMGHDGATGLRALRDAGGVTIAQDEESSVVFGMPKEAIRLGAAEHVLPASAIAAAIGRLVASPEAS